MTSALTADSWLSRTLKTNTFALRHPLPEDVSKSLRHAAAGEKAFFFCKVPVRDAASVGLLQRAGFRLIETEVSFEHRGPAPDAPSVPVRLAEARDRERVLAMAGSCFTHSRFHRDPLIGTSAAHEVKRRWAENCLDGIRAVEVLIADQALGFLAVRVVDNTAAIDLVAVDERHQGRGVGSALVREFVRRWLPRASRLVVGTQLSNARSLRLYERCGFHFQDAAYVLHAHL